MAARGLASGNLQTPALLPDATSGGATAEMASGNGRNPRQGSMWGTDRPPPSGCDMHGAQSLCSPFDCIECLFAGWIWAYCTRFECSLSSTLTNARLRRACIYCVLSRYLRPSERCCHPSLPGQDRDQEQALSTVDWWSGVIRSPFIVLQAVTRMSSCDDRTR